MRESRIDRGEAEAEASNRHVQPATVQFTEAEASADRWNRPTTGINSKNQISRLWVGNVEALFDALLGAEQFCGRLCNGK